MSRDELLRLADSFQKKADSAAENYQETGISRYGSTARRNEDIAEALRMAAQASDEHHAYISMKGQMSNFAWRAQMASGATGEEREELVQALINDLAAYGRMVGLIERNRKEDKE